MIRSLLEAARDRRGRARSLRAPFDPAAAVLSVLAAFEADAAARGVLLAFRAGGAPAAAIGDRACFVAAVGELVRTALAGAAGGCLSIRLKTELAMGGLGLRLELSAPDAARPAAAGDVTTGPFLRRLDSRVRRHGERVCARFSFPAGPAPSPSLPLEGVLAPVIDPHPRVRAAFCRRLRALGAEVAAYGAPPPLRAVASGGGFVVALAAASTAPAAYGRWFLEAEAAEACAARLPPLIVLGAEDGRPERFGLPRLSALAPDEMLVATLGRAARLLPPSPRTAVVEARDAG